MICWVTTSYFSRMSRRHNEQNGEHCPDFIDKDSWPPNSPDLNPLEPRLRRMGIGELCWSINFGELNSKLQNVDLSELKVALQAIWNDLSDETIRRSVMSFHKRLTTCVKAQGGHFEHSIN